MRSAETTIVDGWAGEKERKNGENHVEIPLALPWPLTCFAFYLLFPPSWILTTLSHTLGLTRAILTHERTGKRLGCRRLRT
jgi:hypothetical protein